MQGKIVPNWRLKPQARGQVEVKIKTVLDSGLQPAYDADTYEEKVAAAFRYVFERFDGLTSQFIGSLRS